jgi:Phosphotransferase enzyme family
MTLLLSSENVLDYLANHLLLEPQDKALAKVTAQEYRNFNLVVSLANRDSLLVKQERISADKDRPCGFWREQRIYELFQHFTDLNNLQKSTSEVVYFDPDSSIIIQRYFDDYCNLGYFYADRQSLVFPVAIAQVLGRVLAKVHCSTWNQASYQLFLEEGELSGRGVANSPSFLQGLERFGPGIFSKVSLEALDFWRLYQRYDSLHQAVVEVAESYQACCLIHGDLEFRNILVKTDGNDELSVNPDLDNLSIKLIDWEFFRWGDPAYDLGIVLSSYLDCWLDSLVVSKAIPIQTALKLATTPLELLQPSITGLVKSYLAAFPAILEHHPQFLRRVVQFTGLALVKQIQGNLEHLQSFDNSSICKLQVAKMLLCNPEQSVVEIFGTNAADLIKTGTVLSC